MASKPNQKGAAAPTTATKPTVAAAAAAPTAPALPWQGVQHGVQPPKRAGLCAAVWQLTTAGMVQGNNGEPPTMPTLAAVKAAGVAQGLNPTNVAIEYYRCRQWYGVRGRQGKVDTVVQQV